MKKAFLVIPHWADDKSISWGKANSSPTYAESAGKAKYQKFLDMDFLDEDEWFKYRSLRWPEMDLFPPEEHELIKELSESMIRKMIHTCGADRKNSDRNCYNGSIDDKDFNFLIKKGLAERSTNRDHMLHEGTTYFYLTDLGLKVARSTQEKLRSN